MSTCPVPAIDTPDTDSELQDYLAQCLNIDENDLDGEFCRLPAAVAFWSARFAAALKEEQELELVYDRTKGAKFAALRGGSTKPPAVDECKAMVDADGAVCESRREYITAYAERTRLKGIMDAVMSKRDMLQSLGAQKRAQRDFTMRSRSNDNDWGESA